MADDLDDLDDSLDYAGFLQDALRDMVRRVLAHVAEEGLPGEHHFYIGFRTAYPGVRMPASLLAQHPEEIRIILQNQFWGLEVDETAFSVSLNFAATRHRLTVPFAALTEFRDPAANLLLAFDPDRSAGVGLPEPAPDPAPEPTRPAAVPEPKDSDRTGSVIRFERRPKGKK